MSSEPFFSIVIPTRNRADTLYYTIRSILNQNFQDYEIIVCNNNSIDNTEDVIKSFSDERIKYISSDIDLSMADNWELAYTKVTGQYVTYIADNDGFIQGSLSFLNQLFRLNNYPNIIRWEKNLYNWPCLDSVNKNILYINLEKKFEVYDSNIIIKEILDGKRKFQDLPMIYNSFIKNTLIKSLKLKTGKIFHSASPDLSTGFSFALIGKNYLSLTYGITCGANSAKSSGYNFMRKRDNNISKELINLTKTSNINYHSNIPIVKSIMAAIIEAYLKSDEVLGFNRIPLDFKKIYINIIKNLTIFDESDLEETQSKIIEASKFDKDLYQFIQEYLEVNPLKINIQKEIELDKGFNEWSQILILKGEDYNLYNIEQVCKFMGGFYTYTRDKISYPTLSFFNINTLSESSKVAIWGNGAYGKKLQELILEKRNDLNISCIIDSFKEDFENTIPILVPQNVDFTNIDYLVIASSFLNEIQETLLSLDLKDIKILKYESK